MKKLSLGIRPHLRLISNSTAPLAQSNQPEIVLIASGKGGVGKTWFSIALSQALAKDGKRILLFDGDLGFANVDIQLGILPQHDLEELLEDQVTLQKAITFYKEGGFDILAGHSGGGRLSELTPKRLLNLKRALKSASKLYDTILIDLGAGNSSTLKSLSESATRCIIVIVDEPTSLTDAYTLIKVIHMATPVMPIDIVVNQAETDRSGQQAYDTLLKVCENFLNISPRLLGIIHKDEKVKETICSQSSLLTRFPTTTAAKDIKEITSDF